MVARAKGRYLPVSPRKIRLVTRRIKGLGVLQAEAILGNLKKQAAKPVAKVLASAVANATRGGAYRKGDLFIERILADQGPVFKRFKAAAMGRASPIRKPTCHVTIELDIRTDGS